MNRDPLTAILMLLGMMTIPCALPACGERDGEPTAVEVQDSSPTDGSPVKGMEDAGPGEAVPPPLVIQEKFLEIAEGYADLCLHEKHAPQGREPAQGSRRSPRDPVREQLGVHRVGLDGPHRLDGHG